MEAKHGAAYNKAYAGQKYVRGKKKGKLKYKTRGPDQQAKYLTKPYQEMQNSGETRNTIVKAIKGGASLINALLTAGRRVQRESQKIVPVDLTNLKGSAYTEKE